MTYLIRFPVGDWSGDGHNLCETFDVQSNYPVKQIREIHFKAPEVLGFNIGDICHEYDDDVLDEEIADKLKAIGIDLSEYIHEDEYHLTPNSIIVIWLAILRHIDSTVELIRIDPPKGENISFYGFDEQHRHLDTPGYGTFYV